MSAASTFAITVFERPCPVPDEDGETISRREAARLAALFAEHGVAELVAYALAARIDIGRIAVGGGVQ